MLTVQWPHFKNHCSKPLIFGGSVVMWHNLACTNWYRAEQTSDVQIEKKSNSSRSYFRALELNSLELKPLQLLIICQALCQDSWKWVRVPALKKFISLECLSRLKKKDSTFITQQSNVYDSSRWLYTESKWTNVNISPRNLKFDYRYSS